MLSTTRSGNKWTIPELLQLQREYELLELPVIDIANLHKRTSTAIIARLEQEEMIDHNKAVSLYNDINEINNKTPPVKDEQLLSRIWNLETNVMEIGGIVKQFLESQILNQHPNTRSQLSSF